MQTCGVWSTSLDPKVADEFCWNAGLKQSKNHLNLNIYIIDHIKLNKFPNVPLGRKLRNDETVYPNESEWMLPHGLTL